jgi:hypothetical protein
VEDELLVLMMKEGTMCQNAGGLLKLG